MLIDAKTWAAVESRLLKLPAGESLCARIRAGTPVWLEIGIALVACTTFPTEEFCSLHQLGDFDVRWPLTFAAWYWGVSGASVNNDCATFLSTTALWEQAIKVLPEYDGNEWLSVWRTNFADRIKPC